MGATNPLVNRGSSENVRRRRTKGESVGTILLFCTFLALSGLLWVVSKKWSFILLSELSAAMAGIWLGRIFIGKQTAPGREESKSENAASGTQVEDPNNTARSTFCAFGESFFAARAEPLRKRLFELRKQATLIEPTGPKETLFDDKILEPEYAIGQGLISREELSDFRNSYRAQSELSLGLILPLILIVFALIIRMTPAQIRGYTALWILGSIAAATAFLFVISMERRQKYRVELGLLLVSRWDKQAAADKAAKEAKAQVKVSGQSQEETIRRVLQEELKNLQLEVKPLVVELHTGPEKATDRK